MTLLHSVLSPLILVAASDTSHASVSSSNYASWSHLLAPFGLVHGKLQVRDAQANLTVLDDYMVRFMTPAEFGQFTANPATVQYIANKALQLYTQPNIHLPVIRNVKDVDSDYATVNTDDLTPWFAEYRETICKLIGVGEHETFNHPISCLVIVSAQDADPVQIANDLLDNTVKKLNTYRGALDTSLLRQYIVLHDGHASTDQQVETALTAMRKAFGNACQLVKINSIPKSNGSSSPTRTWSGINYYIDRWRDDAMARHRIATCAAEYEASMKTDGAHAPQETKPYHEDLVEYGSHFSQDDIHGLQTFVKTLVGLNLFPFMERNMQVWNEQVASQRRGLTNRLMTASRRFFGGKQSSAEAAIQDPNQVLYPASSPELVMRRLADYAFMLHDYKFAQSTYDTVKRDFTANDKAAKYLAGSQEMIGICALMSDPTTTGRSVDGYVDAAIHSYAESKSSLYAIRTTLLYYEMLRERGLYRDCPNLLTRMFNIEEIDVRGGLLLEQAGLTYLKFSPPMIRKYAFQTMLAGHWYSRCGLREHAYRCYAQLDSMEKREGWSTLLEHHYYNMAKTAQLLGDGDHAIELFVKLLKPNRGQTPGQQYTYVKDLVAIYSELAGKSSVPINVPSIDIPHIDPSTVYITLLETGQQQMQDGDDDEIWLDMETKLNNLVSSTYKKITSRAPIVSKNLDKMLCAIGEPLFVHFELFNPLQISVAISNVVIECQLEVDPKASTRVSPLPRHSLSSAHSTLIDQPHFSLEMLDKVVLDGLERRTIRLRVHPRNEGNLTILGFRYNIFEVIPCCKLFDKRGKRLNDTLPQRTSQVYGAESSLKLLVTAPMPLIDVAFHSWPSKGGSADPDGGLLLGEVVQTVMEITNKGNRGLVDLRIKISHPTFLFVGSSEQIDLPVYAPSINESKMINVSNALTDPSVVSVNLPITDSVTGEMILGPNSTTLIPVWLRGESVGRHHMKFLFSYRSEDKNDKIGFRTFRSSMVVDVMPSLRVNAFTRPSPRTLNDFIVGVEIENMHPHYDFAMGQMTCASRLWELEAVDDAKPAPNLSHKNTTFCFFKLSRLDAGLYKFDSSPENMSISAIESLIVKDTPQVIQPGSISLSVSTVPLGTSPSLYTTIPLQGLTTNSRIDHRVTGLSSQYPMLKHSQLDDLFTLYVSDEVDLVLYYQVQTTSSDGSEKLRQGHLYLFGINLSPQNSMPFDAVLARNNVLISGPSKALFAETVRERKLFVASLMKPKQKETSPVRVEICCDGEVVHDFVNESFCVIRVLVVVRNSSWMNRAHFVLELISGKGSDATSPEYQWLGTPFCEATLEPESEFTFENFFCVLREGVYNVSNWMIHVRTSLASGDVHAGGVKSDQHFTQTSGLPQYVTVYAA
ncbi:hypothetical protein SmJEL517_g05349 [Synchytrium microbalum]|uniref:Trafficking protein particle complex subunit 11 domain-containing protein n=1 Tax=Synchytrium microbalum TaxID=1806994 RepID=A0A507BZY5_9FUNG|nr:uncharacterized protein SmJEL517_g05349 [Synchytrium microbalum]TPX31316.1 hypothetical protein SmJEL517_g05349 [Synchytrium microbalum]